MVNPYFNNTPPSNLLIVDPGLQLWGSERALAATLKALTDTWEKVVLVTPPDAELASEVAANPEHYGLVNICHAPIGMLHKKKYIAKLVAIAHLASLIVKFRASKVYLNQAGLAKILMPLVRTLGVPMAIHVRILEDVARTLILR